MSSKFVVQSSKLNVLVIRLLSQFKLVHYFILKALVERVSASLQYEWGAYKNLLISFDLSSSAIGFLIFDVFASVISLSAGPTFFSKKVGKKSSAFHSAPQAAPVHRMPPYAAPGLL